MGGISMAVKFRHKETGLFFCRAKGLSPSRRDYDKLGEEGIFRKRHLSKRGRIYESATENQKLEGTYHMEKRTTVFDLDAVEKIIKQLKIRTK